MRRTHGWALIALALVAGGCGSSSDDGPSKRASTAPATTTATTTTTNTTTTTTTPAPEPTRTSTTPRSTSGNGTLTTTPTTPTKTKTKTAPATKSTPAKLGKPQIFDGDGARVIGNLVLKRNAVVRWTVTGGGAFTVRDAGGRLKISGRGPNGQTFAESGEYRSVKVTARGRWTLSFATLGA
ncbi:MAG: hypothetical protein QOJ63_2070 [Solirubrobacteraceae bacterium]|nr:hypothetical protein [Solirubrobacteraceae bacterium]